jgi:pimeloyl-ACP methyl ester carboxylesterase
LWTEFRGADDLLLVLLHGLFTTAAVWEPLDSILATSWPGRRLLIDLPGHGRSDALPEYSFGVVAAGVARTIKSHRPRVPLCSMAGSSRLRGQPAGFMFPSPERSRFP